MLTRLGEIVGWLKANPVVGLIGVGASVFTCIRAAPLAWNTVMHTAGLPRCIYYQPLYHYPNGTFQLLQPGTPGFQKQDARVGNLSKHANQETQEIIYWHEHQIPAGATVNGLDFDFREASRTGEYIYLINLTPRPQSTRVMLVRIPACGGVSQWTYEDPEKWADMFHVWR